MHRGAEPSSSGISRSNWLAASSFIAFLTFSIATSCLLSWFFKAPQVNALSHQWIPVAPSTAICFMAISGGLFFQSISSKAFFRRHFPLAVAVLLMVLAGLRLLELVVPFSTQVDRWLFHGGASHVGDMPAGIMAVPTALGFFFLGMGLLATPYLERRVAMAVVVLSTSGALGLGTAFLLGYVYGAPLMYGNATIPMAFLTALCFVLSSLAIFSLLGGRLAAERSHFLSAIQGLNTTLQQRVFELEQIQADFASLAQRNLNGLIVQDVAGRLIYANDAARQLLGNDLEVDWLPQATVPVFEQVFQDKVLEVRCEATNWRGSPGLLLCLSDVSARRAAQESLNSSREQLFLAQKMEAVGRLAGGIAHDFNNILTAILGYCDLLQEETTLSEEARQSLAEVMRAAQRAADLTRQLLTYSKHAPFSPQSCELNGIVKKASGLLERLLKDEVDLEFEFWPEPVWVQADPSRLEQVLMNLVINARDASNPGSRVSVRVFVDSDEEGGKFCGFSVSDSGEGVAEEDLLKIFDPFFTTKSPSGGTGLGLSICRSIAEQCGGQLLVQSSQGQGAVFTLRLQPASEPIESEVPSTPGGRGCETILLVDDEEPIRRLLKAILAKHGYRVLEASGPAEAEKIATEQVEIDLLVTDMAMPGGSGLDLVQLLTAKRPGLRAILMSGHCPETAEGSEGALPYLQKPFTASKLLDLVEQVLKSSAPSPNAKSHR